MKILFIGPGNDVHLARWINRISVHNQDLYFYNSTPTLTSEKIDAIDTNIFKFKHTFLKTWPIRIFSTYFELKKIIRDVDPDIIHLHWLLDIPQYISTFMKFKNLLATPYGSDILLYANKEKKKLLRFHLAQHINKRIISKSKAFCCDGNHLIPQLKKLGATNKLIELIYFGTDVKTFSPAAKNLSFFEKYRVPKHSFIILSNRGFLPIYSIETLLEAGQSLKKSIKNLAIVIVGGGVRDEYLREFAKIQAIDDVTYFIGRLNSDDFVEASASCDVYVSTSTSDGGLAASVAEAMSCETAVVITDFGDNKNWLKNESAGLVFPIKNSFSLAEKIIYLYNNPIKRKNLGIEARKIIEIYNNSEIETLKTIDFYSKVLDMK
jgi:glycosyltransferase involved in cell wall biosynthesis